MHVSILMVRALAGVIERSGGSREQFLREARVDPQWLEEGTLRLPIGDYLRAVEAALKVSGDPAFGLRLGEQARPGMFHLIGPMTEQARTLRESIDTMQRYARLMAENNAPELLEAGGSATLRFPSLHGDRPWIRLTAEFAMTAFLSSFNLFVGSGVQPNEARFAFPEPPYAAEYRRIFGERVVFGSATTEMVFPREWLDKTQPYGSRELYEVLKEQAERSLDRLERDAPLRERIEQIIAKHGTRLPSMDDVARDLGMSARSLRRRMQSEGLSFSDLAERTRTQIAKRMLERPGSSIQEAAFALGFASPAAFHRAFKRWTGLTPKQYQDSF